MLSNNFISALQSSISDLLKESISIDEYHVVGGGSINECFKLITKKEPYFIKVNDDNRFPGMFEAERSGLDLLRKNSSLLIPKVLLVDHFESKAFIVMDYIEKGSASSSGWRSMGSKLAKLHQNSHSHFGLDHDNYIGSLPQTNTQLACWIDFFVTQRLELLIKMAIDSGNLDKSLNRPFDKLFNEMENIFPIESPALLHGDLWSGNFMFGTDDHPSIYDPAVYYGHREMDLAMTFLFGGFDSQFYEAYNETFPLEKNWRDRIEIANLYPLLVHVVLFGSSYLSAIKQTLKPFR